MALPSTGRKKNKVFTGQRTGENRFSMGFWIVMWHSNKYANSPREIIIYCIAMQIKWRNQNEKACLSISFNHMQETKIYGFWVVFGIKWQLSFPNNIKKLSTECTWSFWRNRNL